MAASRTHFVIGSRKSDLALWQARAVKSLLEKAFPSLTFDIKTEITLGDRVLGTHLSTLAASSPGLFTKELETGLLVGSTNRKQYCAAMHTPV
jgi:hydroxymethylbilane synthase